MKNFLAPYSPEGKYGAFLHINIQKNLTKESRKEQSSTFIFLQTFLWETKQIHYLFQVIKLNL